MVKHIVENDLREITYVDAERTALTFYQIHKKLSGGWTLKEDVAWYLSDGETKIRIQVNPSFVEDIKNILVSNTRRGRFLRLK